MMHPLAKELDKNEPKLNCDNTCKNYMFDHRDVACVLSDVFSTSKGSPCALHTKLKTIPIKNVD